MRAAPVALLLVTAVAPAQAGVGLPEVGTLRIGTYQARVLNDSAGLRKGTNILTVHIPDLPPGQSAALRLRGPQGEVIEVALRPLRVLRGTAGHDPLENNRAAPGRRGSHDGGHHGEQPLGPAHGGNGHGVPGHGDKPDEAAGDGGKGHGAPGLGGDSFPGYAVRGAARLPATGAWRAVLTVDDGHGEPLTAELPLEVTTNGPAPLFLGLTGFLIGGSLLYGSIQRRRAAGRR